MRKRGMTLIELIIYMTLFILASFALLQLYLMGNSTQRTTTSNYILSGDTETAIRTLRNDIQRTALISIRTYGDNTSEPPGCSMASDLTPGNETVNVIPSSGAPLWTSTVFYTLTTKGSTKGELIRWEESVANPDNLPHPSLTMPSALSTKFRHTLLNDAVLRNVPIKGLTGQTNYNTGTFGGFRVQFVQRTGGETGAEVMSNNNPGDLNNAPATTDGTKLIEVELKILTSEDTSSQPSFYDVVFRVHTEY
jgi:type II secretory pathway pseudopilin PulG